MQSKSLLIAIAAFAVTTTGVHAYGGARIQEKANLTTEQKSALEEAKEFRELGDIEAARDILIEAGIDEDVLRSIHQAKKELHKEIWEAVENGDYQAFVTAIENGPLADIITSEADFERFKEAHELKLSGEKKEAQGILGDLGIDRETRPHLGKEKWTPQLSDDQKEALFVARQSNDREAIDAILEEAGVERSRHTNR